LLLFLQENKILSALYQPPWRLTHRKQGKAFFFEKKKQKAFACAATDSAGKVRVSTDKSFLVLFLEKGLLACYDAQSMVAMMLLPGGHIIAQWLTMGKVEECCFAGGPEANRTAARRRVLKFENFVCGSGGLPKRDPPYGSGPNWARIGPRGQICKSFLLLF
jgi:hypothetical protein